MNLTKNSTKFNSLVRELTHGLFKKKLDSNIKKVKDKVLKIKLQEAINCVDKFCLNESKQTDDNSVVQLLRYYELDKELDKV